MEEKKGFFERIHNEGFTWKDSLIVILLTYVVLFLVGTIMAAPIEKLFAKITTDENRAFVTALSGGCCFIGYWIVVLIYCLIVKPDRPLLRAVGKEAKGNTVKMLLIGFVIGLAANALCVGVAVLHGDISFTYDSFPLFKLILVFLTVFIQAGGEEIISRGFLYQKLRKTYKNPLVAILVNPIIFVVMHLLQPGINILSVLSIYVVAILFSFCVYLLDSLWAAMAIHTTWNFSQSIIFGLPNSGNIGEFSILKLNADTAKDSVFYHTTFGVEATVTAIAVLALTAFLVYLYGKKKGIKALDVWNKQEA